VFNEGSTPFKVISAATGQRPVVGEIAFFLGVPQPYLHKVSAKSHVKLLALSKEEYEEVGRRCDDAWP
jgi:hypothetical protein